MQPEIYVPTQVEIEAQRQVLDDSFTLLMRTTLELKAERDELLEALKQILGSIAWSPSFDRALDKGRKAVAKAEGRHAT